jgi:beta-N-acetylhexosaminidase
MMSLEERAGQLLMIGTQATNPATFAAVLHRYPVGGVFLAGRTAQSASALHRRIQLLQEEATATGVLSLHVAIDQEGGQVQTFQGADFPTIPSAVTQGRWSAAQLRATTLDWAKRLVKAGVTLDLAPVADTVPAGFASSNPPIGAFGRQFGSEPEKVAEEIAIVVDAVDDTQALPWARAGHGEY